MRARRQIDGVLLLDKPVGLSSNAALQRAKRIFQAAKAGHGGTLDPLASGLLPILFGEATKFAARMLDSQKSYIAWVKLGETTATADAEGPILTRRPVRVDPEMISSVLERFRGPILQIPPMYSALKRDGRPLYQLARAGQTVDRAPRSVEISKLELRSRAGDCLELEIRCSKGTYVRTLAADIGEALDTGAHLAALRRTVAGRFSVTDAIGLDALEAEAAGTLDERLLPLECLFDDLPRIDLDARESTRFGNGQVLQKQSNRVGLCGVFSDRGAFIGLARADTDGWLRPHRLRSVQAAEIVAENHAHQLK